MISLFINTKMYLLYSLVYLLLLLGFDWLHSGCQNHLYVYMLLSGIPLFRVMSEDCALLTSQKILVPYQPSGRLVIPSGRSSVHCSICPDDVPYHPDV
jgi:hypothetical protein